MYKLSIKHYFPLNMAIFIMQYKAHFEVIGMYFGIWFLTILVNVRTCCPVLAAKSHAFLYCSTQFSSAHC